MGLAFLTLAKSPSGFRWAISRIHVSGWSRQVFKVARSHTHHLSNFGCVKRMVCCPWYSRRDNHNDPQFTSAFEIFLKLLNMSRVLPYHLASNGLAERFIQSLNKSESLCKWWPYTDSKSLLYCTTAHSTTGVLPCKLMQRDLCTHLSLLLPNTEQLVMEKQSVQKSITQSSFSV